MGLELVWVFLHSTAERDASEASNQGQTERQNKTNSQTGCKYDITAPTQLPLAEGCPGDWQALQLGCGHWGRHLDTLSRAQRRHEKLSHKAAATRGVSCAGELMISYRLVTACGFP